MISWCIYRGKMAILVRPYSTMATPLRWNRPDTRRPPAHFPTPRAPRTPRSALRPTRRLALPRHRMTTLPWGRFHRPDKRIISSCFSLLLLVDLSELNITPLFNFVKKFFSLVWRASARYTPLRCVRHLFRSSSFSHFCSPCFLSSFSTYILSYIFLLVNKNLPIFSGRNFQLFLQIASSPRDMGNFAIFWEELEGLEDFFD